MSERGMQSNGAAARPDAGPAASARPAGEAAGQIDGQGPLHSSDLNEIRSDKMGEGAVKVARKVAAAYVKSSAAGGERVHAEAIFGEWLQRGAEVVRATLAKYLAACGFLPHRFASAMAEDVESVAVPVLAQSEVLTEEDLCRIAAHRGLAQQSAIAGRRFVPHEVSNVLIGRGETEVAIKLLGNEGAKLSEPALHRIMDAFNRDSEVVDALTGRGRVPSSVADRIVTLIAEPVAQTTDEASPSGERAHPLFARRLGITKPRHRRLEGMDPSKLADQFAAAGRLTPAFLLRALCDGRRGAFEAGMARLAGLAMDKTIALLMSGDAATLTALFKRTGVPEPFRRAFHDGIAVLIRGAELDPAKAMTAAQIGEAVMEVFKNDDAINPDDYKAVLARLYAELAKQAKRTRQDGSGDTTAAA